MISEFLARYYICGKLAPKILIKTFTFSQTHSQRLHLITLRYLNFLENVYFSIYPDFYVKTFLLLCLFPKVHL